MELPIIYQDDHFVVINKPINLPVHKRKGMPHDAPYVTKLLGQQLGESVYNVHRLDAKTSGLLLVARSVEMARQLTELFAARQVKKTYHAIVKGEPGEGVFEQKVKKIKRGPKVNAHTAFRCMRTVATGLQHKEADNLHLSWLALYPTTGRWHQLRQHCAQNRFDILGDSEHGDFPLNRLVAEQLGFKRLYLHATSLAFEHPVSKEAMAFTVPDPEAFDLLWALVEAGGFTK